MLHRLAAGPRREEIQEKIHLLLNAGAQINIKTSDGQTPPHIVAAKLVGKYIEEFLNMYNFLVEYGADPTI